MLDFSSEAERSSFGFMDLLGIQDFTPSSIFDTPFVEQQIQSSSAPLLADSSSEVLNNQPMTPNSHHGYPPQQPGYYSSSEPPVNVQHVAHEDEADRHHHRPHMPSFMHHHDQRKLSELVGKPTVRVVTKAESNFSLTIRDGQVILARSNHSDPFQHWIKDEKFSTRVKDEEGFPSFALVNKATGQAIKHSVGATQPVQLIDYNPDVLDESVLWTESRDLGDGHRTIRMVNNIRLNVDAFNGDKNHGGVHDGTTIVLWEWKKGDNQRWMIIPY